MLEQLAHHPRLDDLGRLVEKVAQASAPDSASAVLRAADELSLRPEDAESPFGSVIEMLEQGPQNPDQRALLASLLARGLALSPVGGVADEERLRAALVWLATIAERSRAESRNAPVLARGEIASSPKSTWALIFLGVTGLLFVKAVVRLIGRFLLSYRRPVEVQMTDAGLSVRTRTQLLGRVLRERETHIPLEGLSHATRDVRYPGLPLYLGVLGLGLGSYIGMGLVADGARAASPSMAGAGALVVLVGLSIDFVTSSLLPGRAGRCRMLIVPRRGPTLSVGAVDIANADRLLEAIASR